MNRTSSICGRTLVALGFLLLLQACASTPRRGLTLEAARESLQCEYGDLLKSFDLHLGTFTVDEATWDTLSPASRATFVSRCSEARREITRETAVRAEANGRVLVAYDGRTSVFYGGSPVATLEQELAMVGQTEATPVASNLLVSIPRPVYPASALRAGVEGTVLIQACVVPDGSVQSIVVVDGGIDALNSAALDAVRKAEFRPFQSENGPESMWVRIPIRFSIVGEHLAAERASHGDAGTSLGAVGSAGLEAGGSGGK